MLTIEGIYDDGKIEPLKPIPYRKKTRVVITFLNKISEGIAPGSAATAIKSLRGCDKGAGLTKTLIESRKEDIELENAKWR
jgi:predicted DNA-binding antitoxin AbrB/MazE fold protein